MTSIENSVGSIHFGPAVARGGATAGTLRSLAELATGTAGGALTVGWRDTAIVAVLGQLAAITPAACARILAVTSTVAKAARSWTGLEAVFLSALLGTPENSPTLYDAEMAWTVVGPPAAAGDDLVPVLQPGTGEVCFLARADIAGMDHFQLRGQVAELCAGHAAAPGSVEDQLAFGRHLLVAASAVSTAQLIAGEPDSSEYTSPAVAVIPSADRGPRLAQQLLDGVAQLVQVGLLAGSDLPSPSAAWRSVRPMTSLLPVDRPVAAHPFWKQTKLCPSLPPTDPRMGEVLVVRGNSLVLPSLPRFDDTGKPVSLGFGPHLDGVIAAPVLNGTGQPPDGVASTVNGHPPQGGHPITMTDPLTGQTLTSDGHGGWIPSGDGSPGLASGVRQRLVDTALSAGLSPETPVIDALNRMFEADYGPA